MARRRRIAARWPRTATHPRSSAAGTTCRRGRGAAGPGRRTPRAAKGTTGDTVAHMRVEHDTMGEVLVPDDARWSAHTQRAVDNFPVSGEPIHREVIAALAA